MCSFLSWSHCLVYLPYVLDHCSAAATNRFHTKPVQLVQWSLADCPQTVPLLDFCVKKKSPVVRTPPDDTPSHIGNLGDALDTQRLVFHFFCVHFLMEVGYSQTELSSVKKKKKKTFRQLQLLWAWHQSKSVNALVLAYLLAVLKEKRAFSPSLNCSAHWEWFAWIQQGSSFNFFILEKC